MKIKTLSLIYLFSLTVSVDASRFFPFSSCWKAFPQVRSTSSSPLSVTPQNIRDLNDTDALVFEQVPSQVDFLNEDVTPQNICDLNDTDALVFEQVPSQVDFLNEDVTPQNICDLIDTDALVFEQLPSQVDFLNEDLCHGMKPLIYTVFKGKTKAVNALIQAGAGLNFQDRDGIL
jgi:hypothetical protein